MQNFIVSATTSRDSQVPTARHANTSPGGPVVSHDAGRRNFWRRHAPAERLSQAANGVALRKAELLGQKFPFMPWSDTRSSWQQCGGVSGCVNNNDVL